MGRKKLVRKAEPPSKRGIPWPRWTGFRGMTYYEAGGFGPEPEIDWPEDEDSAEFEQAEDAYAEWYAERSGMFWDLIVDKATNVVVDHHEAIVRVAVALCYQGTLSGYQVAEIVERVEGAERSAA